jgi:hypothetical protein
MKLMDLYCWWGVKKNGDFLGLFLMSFGILNFDNSSEFKNKKIGIFNVFETFEILTRHIWK